MVMRYYNSLLFTGLLLMTVSVLAQSVSTISLSSETRSIYLGDSVVLDIESTGLTDPLDVTALRRSPDFLRETTGTRIAVIDGKVVEIAIRRMEFIPDKEGTVLYGPLTGESQQGAVRSNSIAVQIKPALNTDWKPAQTDLQGEIRFSNNQPMIGEQIIADIVLRHKYQIANEQFSLPDFTDFDVLSVYEQRRTIESVPDQGDADWRIVAWRLLLHAKKSGTMELQTLNWSGTMIKSRSQRGEFSRSITATPLRVQPTPVDRPEWWLPATSVQVADSWSKDVRTLSAGVEIIRTITLTATNILSNQVPTIEPYPTRALTSTLIRATRDHKLTEDQTTATGVFEFRMVAQSPIPVFLDTVRVPWWNTTTRTREEAIIPARRINVGLPDRADLLADLAVNNSRLSRWLFSLRSYARCQPLLIALGSILVIAALYPLLRDGVQHDHVLRRRRKLTRKLQQLQEQKDWQALYRELNQLEQKDIIDTTAQPYQNLVSDLQQVLFRGNATTLNQLSRKRIELRFKPFVLKQNTPVVGTL